MHRCIRDEGDASLAQRLSAAELLKYLPVEVVEN
jgi:hypothetical protein